MMKRRADESVKMRKLLMATSTSKSRLKLRLLNGVYEKLGDGGRRSLLGLYLTRMSDVFSREEYRMFIDAFKLITAEMFPSIVEWTRTKTIGEVWKMLRGPKLDFLKTKLELIFPKVLGRAMRKLSNVPSKAPILTEAVLFREALRILDPSDAKIAEIALRDEEADMEGEEAAEGRLKAQKRPASFITVLPSCDR